MVQVLEDCSKVSTGIFQFVGAGCSIHQDEGCVNTVNGRLVVLVLIDHQPNSNLKTVCILHHGVEVGHLIVGNGFFWAQVLSNSSPFSVWIIQATCLMFSIL